MSDSSSTSDLEQADVAEPELGSGARNDVVLGDDGQDGPRNQVPVRAHLEGNDRLYIGLYLVALVERSDIVYGSASWTGP